MSDIVVGIQDGRESERDIYRRISWGAVWGGVLTALSVELVFLTLGLAIGFALFTGGAAAWTIAWYLVSMFCSLYVGGWVAGRLCGNPDRSNGSLHGFVVWGLATFATFAGALWITWDAVKGALSVLNTAAASNAQVPVPANPTHAATMASGDLFTLFIVLFGGIILGAVGAMIGGGGGTRGLTSLVRREPTERVPEGQPRHA